MSDLNTQFVAAREGSRDLARRPDDQCCIYSNLNYSITSQ